jgi:hypothetical protein
MESLIVNELNNLNNNIIKNDIIIQDKDKDKDTFNFPIKNQSQHHGFYFENEIKSKVFHLNPNVNDTKKHDIECSENILNPNENISIKLTSGLNIDCGDIIRFYSYDFQYKNTIIVGFYNQVNENEKKIYQVMEIDYNEKFHNILFGNITLAEIKEYVDIIKSIPPGKINKTDKKYLVLKKELQNKYNMYINISPKVDSKNQRRVQCSIPKIKDLLKRYPEFITYNYSSYPLVIRNVIINENIQSYRRLRKKNIKL